MYPRTFVGLAFVLLLSVSGPTRALGQCQTWSTDFTTLYPQGQVYALETFDDGTGPALWVGGSYGLCCPWPGAVYIAKWDGHTWQGVGQGNTALNADVDSLAVYDDGTGPAMYAGGVFALSPPSLSDAMIARWNGSHWVSVGGGLMQHPQYFYQVLCMTSYDDGSGPSLYVGGIFGGTSTLTSRGIIRWDGSGWSALGTGLDGQGGNYPYVYAMTVFDDGSGPALYVGGDFVSAGGVPAGGVAKWDGVGWSAVGSNVRSVEALAVFDDGTGSALYAGGYFGTNRIARWNGINWVPLSTQPNSPIHALHTFDDGNGPALAAAGSFGYAGGQPVGSVAKWNGTNWAALGSGVGSIAWSLGTFDDGSGRGASLYVGGQFLTAGGGTHSTGIAEWIRCNGPIDPTCPGDTTLAACPCGNNGAFGHGCQNSASTGGALLTASGTTFPDNLVLTSSGELANSLSIFLQGNALSPTVALFGDGLRCAGGLLLRLYVKNASAGTAQAPQAGDPSISARSASLGDPIQQGTYRYYQTYYRDPNMSFCPNGSTFNASSGIRAVWGP